MITTHSESELLIKRDLHLGENGSQKNIEQTVENIQAIPLSPEEWGIINSLLFDAKDASLIRQVLLSSHPAPNFSDHAMAKYIVSLGEKLLLKKKFGRAGRLFSAAITLDSHLIEAYILRAETLVQRKHYEKAVKFLKHSIRNHPKFEALAQYGANLAEYEGDYTRLAYFERSMLKANPQDSRTFLNLLQLLTDHAKFDEMVEFARAHPIPSMNERDLFRAYNLLVNAYEEIKQYDKALYYANAALAIKPKRLALWETKANIYRKLGQNQETLKCLQQMVKIKPHAKKYTEDAYKFGKKHHLY